MSFPDLFRWTDLTLVDYVNWSEGQPGTDNCIEMDIDLDGRWSTDNCNDNSAFVCKNPVCKLLLASLTMQTASSLPKCLAEIE